MKKHYYFTPLLASMFIASGAYSETLYLNGIWEKGKTQSFSSPQAWNTSTGTANKVIGKNDTLCIIDRTGYTKIDGNFTIKNIDLGRFLAEKSSIGNITFTITKDSKGKKGSLTIDTNTPKAKNSVAITSNFTTKTNSQFWSKPKPQQILTITGGNVSFLNSANPAGSIEFKMNTQASPMTLPTFQGGIKFACPVQIYNDLLISSNNKTFSEGLGHQVSVVSFLDKTVLGVKNKKNLSYKNLKVAKLPTAYFQPLMIVNIGDEKHSKAHMSVGNFTLDRGSKANVYGTLDINGNLDISWAASLDVKKGGVVNVTSKNIGKFAEIKTSHLARINVDGALNVINPKLHKDYTKFVDVQMFVGENGSLKIDGTGVQGLNGLYLERSLLSLKKGAKVYARNMVRLGEKSRLQLFGENQISAKEPANKLCRLMISGRDTIVEAHANQHFDSFGLATSPVTLRICGDTNEIRFAQIATPNWNKNFVLNIEGFKNGVIKVDKNDPMISTNITAKGWKNFRLENGVLTADKK